LNKVSNEDAERNFIAKLKRTMGDVYTNKLEGMFNDIKASAARKQEFKDFCTGKSVETIDLSVNILNKLAWPISKNLDLTLPKLLQDQIVIYEDYYKAQINANHKLDWLWNQGNILLNYSFPDKQKKMLRFELNISVTQASILLLFNENNTYVFKNIGDILNISNPTLKASIGPLIFSKMRLLANRGPDGKGKPKVEGKNNSTEIDDNDLITVTPLNAKKKRITYPPRSKSIESKLEDSNKVKEKTQEERGVKIELAIVRVMKSRNLMNQQELIAEATKQLTKFFKPNVRMVKKKIELLMEREFLKRDDNDHKIIHYLA